MKMMIGIAIMLVISGNSLLSQAPNDLERLSGILGKSEGSSFTKYTNYENEYQLVFSGLFLFYKNYISSQDASQCTFSPSCSVYAIQAIQKEGIIMGVVNFFDRFSRCNGLSPEQYPYEPRQNLLLDPVTDFHFH
jgi:uncharacterized protein